ncbi:MAG: STAS domain-containing protein [Candidatus Eisenbacteria bacterium]|uniref:STAS domain-containing protein n=1 Tax=Eiseniibacteriota bacterium TaxID=2212470 RepID=A0A9D6QJ43_UNCEI|nr:STAS domain-containing protein [Candidatus Eisenbacteria bacterium]
MPAMIEQREGRVTVITPAGNLVTDEENRGLEDAQRGAVDRGDPRIVVDMRRVQIINSIGFGVILDGFRRAGIARARFCLCAMTPRVHYLMNMLHLIPTLEYFPTLDEALAALAADDAKKG